MPNPVTASGVDLALVCKGMRYLPRVNNSSAAATRGTRIHQFLSDCIVHGREFALSAMPEEVKEVCEAIDLLQVFGTDTVWKSTTSGDLMSEVSYAWNSTTDEATVLGTQLNRNYPDLQGDWIVGTADAVTLGRDAVFVDDFKTGRIRLQTEGNTQLEFLCLAAARSYNLETAYARIIQIEEDGWAWSQDHVKYDRYDLAKFAEKFAQVFVGDELTVGDHCKYCPAFTNCPEQIKTTQALVAHEGKALTTETIPKVWRQYVAVKNICKQVEAAIGVAIDTTGPVDLGDGTRLEKISGTRREIDASKALPILDKLLGADAIPDSVSISKASIKRACKLHSFPEEKKIFEALEAADGLITKQTKPTVKVVKKPLLEDCDF